MRLQRLLLLTALLPASLALLAMPARAQEGTSNPERRRAYLDMQRAFPFERIPPRATRMQMLSRYRGTIGLGQSAALMAEGDWESAGPAPIGVADAGRVSALAIDPRNPQVIYAGAAQGGIWKTTNGGASWVPLTDTQCSLATGSIALDPRNPDIIYVGTGEQNYSGDSYYGCGVLKSTNGGATWTTLGASIFDTNTGGARIGRTVVIPGAASAAASSVILTGSTMGLYRSADAGNSWTRVQITGNPASQVTDIVLDPRNPQVVYAAYTSTGQNAANGVYKSTDGGLTFPTRLAAGFPSASVGRIALAISPSGPDTLYAAIHNPTNSQLLGIWRTANGGTSWTQASAFNASCGSQCWYNIVIAVDPTTASVVYFGGVSMYRSLDAGQTFTVIGNNVHVDHHALEVVPGTQTVISGNDGGVFRSNDRGLTWSSLNSNLAITQFYAGVSFGPAGGGQMIGGTQDNGTASFSGAVGWPRVIGGDGGFTAVNPITGMAFGETQWSSSFGGPRRAASYTGPFVGNPVTAGINMSDAALFIPPLVMDYARPHTLYFGTTRLYRTRNNADAWTAVNNSVGRFSSGRTSAIAPAMSDSAVVYVGTNDGNVVLTQDDGATWLTRSAGLPLAYVSDVVVHRSNPDIAYVALSGFGHGHIWKTTNAGVSWTSVSSNLPDMPVNGLVLLPDGALYAGTDLGVYRSTNDGVSWQAFGNGLPNVAVFDIIYHPGTGVLAAATHGRSIFTTRVTAPAAPTAMALVTTPRGGGSGQKLARQPVVRIDGAAGDPVNATNTVTAVIASGTGTLSGQTSVAAVNGVATFSDLAITGSGAFTLRFDSPGLAAVTTAAFNLASLRGDVTEDGAIDGTDADAILRSIVKLPVPGGYRITPNGDANCDGVVNAVDAAIILSYAAGRNVTGLCVGGPIQ